MDELLKEKINHISLYGDCVISNKIDAEQIKSIVDRKFNDATCVITKGTNWYKIDLIKNEYLNKYKGVM